MERKGMGRGRKKGDRREEEEKQGGYSPSLG